MKTNLATTNELGTGDVKTRRWHWLLCILAVLPVSCGDDSECQLSVECGARGVCVEGRCRDLALKTCDQTSDCEAALVDGTWEPSELEVDVNVPPTCYEAACKASRCELVPSALGAPCPDDDGLPCTVAGCDGAGSCGLCKSGACSKGGSIRDGMCWIDGACWKSGDLVAGKQCQRCDPKQSQSAFTPDDSGVPCDDGDGFPCTVSGCDVAGNCVSEANDGLCKPGGPCERASCDTSKGCVVTPAPKTETCVGSDGVLCTEEHCDGAGKCDDTPKPNAKLCPDGVPCAIKVCDLKAGCTSKADDDKCDDAVACTVDSCDVKTGCVFTPKDALCDDDNVCTTNLCGAGAGCVFPGNKAPCASDGHDCTTDVCDGAGTCSHLPNDDLCDDSLACTVDSCDASSGCVFKPQDSACDDGNVCTDNTCSADLGCQVANNTKPCATDGVVCTVDVCDGKGACGHVPDDTTCGDALSCTRDACAPASAFADPKTGCENVDACPYGHSCAQQGQMCVTNGPVIVATKDTANPNPTNPVVHHQSVDASKHKSRLWVAYQSDTCLSFQSGPSFSGTSQLRGAILDSVEASAPKASKPKPATVNFSAAQAQSCQTYPVVKPGAQGDAWMGWVEWVSGDCRPDQVTGGQVRHARLTSAKATGGAWKTGGLPCPDAGAGQMLIIQPGYAPSSDSSETDPAKRMGVWQRIVGAFNEPTTVPVAFVDAAPTAQWTQQTNSSGGFLPLPMAPAMVDTGVKSSASGNGTIMLSFVAESDDNADERRVVAHGISQGAVNPPKVWLSSQVPPSVGAKMLPKGAKICQIDAAVSTETKDVAVLVTVANATDTAVYLMVTDLKGKSEGRLVASSAQGSGCSTGYVGARVAPLSGGGWVVATLFNDGNTPVNQALLALHKASTPKSAFTKFWNSKSVVVATDVDVNAPEFNPPRGGRGLSNLSVLDMSKRQTVSVAYGVMVGNNKAVALETVIVP